MLEEITSELTAADRCDACGAQAVVAMRVTTGAESALRFCRHHSNKHKDALLPIVTKAWGFNGQVIFEKKQKVDLTT